MVNSKEIPSPIQNEEISNVKIDDLESKANEPLPRNVEGWIEKVEKASESSQKVVRDDTTGQVVMTPAAPSNPTVVLPITKNAFAAGFKRTVSDASRWLSVFVLRIIKKEKGKVKFKDNDT